MVVREPGRARERMAARESAHTRPRRARSPSASSSGLPAEEIASLAYQQSLHAKRNEVQLAFVECNRERADAFAAELVERSRRRSGRWSSTRSRRPTSAAPTSSSRPSTTSPRSAASSASWRADAPPEVLAIVDRPARADARAAQPDPARRADRDLLHDRGAGRRRSAQSLADTGLRRGRRDHRPRRSRGSPARPRRRAERGPRARRAVGGRRARSSSSATCSTRASVRMVSDAPRRGPRAQGPAGRQGAAPRLRPPGRAPRCRR